MIRIQVSGLIMALCASAGWATPFDNSTGGTAVATMGPSGNYQTLSQASIAFSAVAGGINRPWVLEIAEGDYLEPNNSGFGNTFGLNGSLTVRPAAGATPTIEFTSPLTALGWFGHLLIGAKIEGQIDQQSATNTFESHGNYVIDGSNSGSTSRDLTIGFGLTSPTNSMMGRVIRVVGHTGGVIIRNLNVTMMDTFGTNHCIELAGGRIGSEDVTPNFALIENCHLLAASTSNSDGIGATVNGTTPPSSTPILGATLEGNLIETTQRGFFANGLAGDVRLNRNIFQISGYPGTGLSNTGIFVFNTILPATYSISNNDITVTSPQTTMQDGQAAFGIWVDPIVPSSFLSIHDNSIRGVGFPLLVNPTDLISRGMSLLSTTSSYEVEHNSISLYDNANITNATPRRVAGIHLAALTTGAARIRNNIVRLQWDGPSGTAPAVLDFASSEDIVSAGNDLVPTGSGAPHTGRFGATNYHSLGDWQSQGFDSAASGGQSVDPVATFPGYWDFALRFHQLPSGLGTVANSDSEVDMDGNARPATGALPGASQNTSELVGEQSLADWTPITGGAETGALGPSFPGDASLTAALASDDDGDGSASDVVLSFTSTEGMSFTQVFSPGGLIGYDDGATLVVRFNVTAQGFTSSSAEPMLRFRWFYGAEGGLGGGTLSASPRVAAAEASRTYTMMFDQQPAADQTQLEPTASGAVRANAVTLAFETVDFDSAVGSGEIELNSVEIQRVETSALIAASTLETQITDFSDPAQAIPIPGLNWSQNSGVTVSLTSSEAAVINASFANELQAPPVAGPFGNEIPLAFGGFSRPAFAPVAASGNFHRAAFTLSGAPNTLAAPLPQIVMSLSTFGPSPTRDQRYGAEAAISPRALRLIPSGPAVSRPLQAGAHAVYLHLPEGGSLESGSPLGDSIGAGLRVIDNADDLGGSITISGVEVRSIPESVLP